MTVMKLQLWREAGSSQETPEADSGAHASGSSEEGGSGPGVSRGAGAGVDSVHSRHSSSAAAGAPPQAGSSDEGSSNSDSSSSSLGQQPQGSQGTGDGGVEGGRGFSEGGADVGPHRPQQDVFFRVRCVWDFVGDWGSVLGRWEGLKEGILKDQCCSQ